MTIALPLDFVNRFEQRWAARMLQAEATQQRTKRPDQMGFASAGTRPLRKRSIGGARALGGLRVRTPGGPAAGRRPAAGGGHR